MRRDSSRWPLPDSPIEWVIATPAMVVIAVLIAIGVGSSSRLSWIGFGLGIALFTGLSVRFTTRARGTRPRVRYLLCVGAIVGFVLGMPFSR